MKLIDICSGWFSRGWPYLWGGRWYVFAAEHFLRITNWLNKAEQCLNIARIANAVRVTLVTGFSENLRKATDVFINIARIANAVPVTLVTRFSENLKKSHRCFHKHRKNCKCCPCHSGHKIFRKSKTNIGSSVGSGHINNFSKTSLRSRNRVGSCPKPKAKKLRKGEAKRSSSFLALAGSYPVTTGSFF